MRYTVLIKRTLFLSVLLLFAVCVGAARELLTAGARDALRNVVGLQTSHAVNTEHAGRRSRGVC